MLRIGVVGYGYWGPNLARNFSTVPGAQLVAVCDANPARLSLAKSRHPGVEMLTDFSTMLKESKLDAVAIATPVWSHFPIALQALQSGLHVFVEKPMTVTSEESRILIEEASKRNLRLMVDHTFVFTGAVRKIKELIEKGELGELYYYDSVRVNLGLFQHDVSVVWDLAVHDLAILDFLFKSKPNAVSATGISHVAGKPENMAYISLFYPERVMAHLNVNWLSPVKVRQTLIGGSKKMILYDDLEPSEKIKIYDKGINVDSESSRHQLLVSYRSGDMWAPQLDLTEALTLEARHFVECINSGSKPITDGESGLRVVCWLEAISRSLQNRGMFVEMPA